MARTSTSAQPTIPAPEKIPIALTVNGVEMHLELDDYADRSGPLRVLWPSSRHLAPKLRVFVDFLAANLVPAVEGESDTAGHSRVSS